MYYRICVICTHRPSIVRPAPYPVCPANLLPSMYAIQTPPALLHMKQQCCQSPAGGTVRAMSKGASSSNSDTRTRSFSKTSNGFPVRLKCSISTQLTDCQGKKVIDDAQACMFLRMIISSLTSFNIDLIQWFDPW